MTKVIEIFFRNKVKLLALLLVPILVSGVIIFLLPRSYQATARLWAIQRYTIIGATGLESNLQATAAMTQATALTELLQTQSFDLAVARDTDLAKHINVPASDTQALQDALFTEISTHVEVTAGGDNLFVITYSNTDPVLAEQVVQAVVAHYGVVSSSHATEEGQQLLKSYQELLPSAQDKANKAAQAVAQYLQANHLTATAAQSDPEYKVLNEQANQASAAVTSILSAISQMNQQLAAVNTGAEGLFRVMDAPTVPSRPESRTKSIMLGGGAGLAIGLLASIIYLLILVRLDQSMYSSADMLAITDHPVLVQIPRLPRRSANWITSTNGNLLPEEGA